MNFCVFIGSNLQSRGLCRLGTYCCFPRTWKTYRWSWSVLFNVMWLMLLVFFSIMLGFRYSKSLALSGLKWNSDMSCRSLWCLRPCLLWQQ